MPGVRSLFHAGSGSKEAEHFFGLHRTDRSPGRAPGTAPAHDTATPGAPGLTRSKNEI